jgi:hypothetical protein
VLSPVRARDDVLGAASRAPQAQGYVRDRQSVWEAIDVHHGFVLAIPAFRIDRPDAMLSHVGERHGLNLTAFGVISAAWVAGH